MTTYVPRDDQEAAFLARLREHSDDDATRSVYADWLEEHSDVALAEYVRLEIARAAQRPGDPGDPDAAALTIRKRSLRMLTTLDWRRVIDRWLGIADMQLVSIDDAIETIESSGLAGTDAIVQRLANHLASLGFEPDAPYRTIHLYPDSVFVPNDLDVSMQPIVVLGDLVVVGQFTDLVEADQSLTLVAGDLRCKTIWQLGDALIIGDVECENVFYGDSLLADRIANRTEVWGSVKTHVLIENGHHFLIRRQLDATARIGRRISVDGRDFFPDDGDLARLDAAVLDEDGVLDEEKLYRRVRAGESVLKP